MEVLTAITHLRDFNTNGHRPVLVLASNHKKYVIKPQKNIDFDYSICNELLAHFLLKLWNIPTPDIALITVKKEILSNSKNSKSYKSSCFQKYFFASEFIENAIELNNFLSFNKKLDYRKIQNPETFLTLGLFDIWVENDDRKPTNYNIILQTTHNKFTPYAIDNAFIFSSLDYSLLNTVYVCNSINDNVLYSQLTKQIVKKIKPTKKWQVHQRDLFYLYIKKCEDSFDEILNNLSSFMKFKNEEIESLRNFLFNEERNKNVFHDFLSRIK